MSLYQYKFETHLGSMLAVANNEALLFLQFSDNKIFRSILEKFQNKWGVEMVNAKTPLIDSIVWELEAYFEGRKRAFETNFELLGTAFQRLCWQALLNIPYGQTRSYQEQSIEVKKPLAYRAVGSANAANPIAIVVPCHRVVNKSGRLGGYAGGEERKHWLLKHEKSLDS